MKWLRKISHHARVLRRVRDLQWQIDHSRMTYVGWAQELHHIRRTGRLDWVDPNTPPIRPAGGTLKPPPQPR